MVDLKNTKQENLWYIVGLIVTDGNLSSDGRHIHITSKDICILERVREALDLKAKIGRKSSGSNKEKKYGFLAFSDVNFYRYLLGIGLTPRKSLTIGEIVVPIKYFSDFTRGIIDGDGNISRWIHSTNKHEQWSLRIVSGSERFIKWFADVAMRHFGVRGRLHVAKFKQKKNPLYIVKFGKIATKIILSKSYYYGCLALPRKQIQANLCIKSGDGWRGYANMST